MPAKFSRRPEWNAGGWAELPAIFSGSPEMLPTASDMLAGFNWDEARRAVAYRVIISAVAGGQELKNEIVNDESEAMFSNLPPGQVKITIAGRNAKGGESAASEPVTATVV
jgi:hypothetical protein